MMELSKSENLILKLENLIKSTEAFQYHEEVIELAYGKPSHYYFDFRRLTGHPEGINAAASVLYDEIMKIGDIKSVGGLESGAIPLATAISHLSFFKNKGKPIHSFYVRKKPKEKGLQKMIEGCIKSPAIVVDDVITTGTSAIKAIKEVRLDNKDVNHLLAIVFRGSEEDKRRIEQEGMVKFHYIFSESHFTNEHE